MFTDFEKKLLDTDVDYIKERFTDCDFEGNRIDTFNFRLHFENCNGVEIDIISDSKKDTVYNLCDATGYIKKETNSIDEAYEWLLNRTELTIKKDLRTLLESLVDRVNDVENGYLLFVKDEKTYKLKFSVTEFSEVKYSLFSVNTYRGYSEFICEIVNNLGLVKGVVTHL